MEVHQHTHTPRKKWAHYFWEFLMLFLAVFCGFLAEYQLEHKIESDRARQYIRSFYEDLIRDTAGFTSIIRSFEVKDKVFKTKEECFNKIISGNNPDACLFTLFDYSKGFTDLVYTDGTLEQLKNAGGLRLLKKNESDSILSYDNLLRKYIKGESTGLQDLQNRIREVIASLLNYKVLLDSSSKTFPVLYNKDMQTVNKYFVMLHSYVDALKQDKENLIEIKEKAMSLIEYFKKEYHLK